MRGCLPSAFRAFGTEPLVQLNRHPLPESVNHLFQLPRRSPWSAGIPTRSSDDRGGAAELADTVALLLRLRTGTSAVRTAGVPARSIVATAVRCGRPDPRPFRLNRRARTWMRQLRRSGLFVANGSYPAKSPVGAEQKLISAALNAPAQFNLDPPASDS